MRMLDRVIIRSFKHTWLWLACTRHKMPLFQQIKQYQQSLYCVRVLCGNNFLKFFFSPALQKIFVYFFVVGSILPPISPIFFLYALWAFLWRSRCKMRMLTRMWSPLIGYRTKKGRTNWRNQWHKIRSPNFHTRLAWRAHFYGDCIALALTNNNGKTNLVADKLFIAAEMRRTQPLSFDATNRMLA